jgi:hypothetical protein
VLEAVGAEKARVCNPGHRSKLNRCARDMFILADALMCWKIAQSVPVISSHFTSVFDRNQVHVSSSCIPDLQMIWLITM